MQFVLKLMVTITSFFTAPATGAEGEAGARHFLYHMYSSYYIIGGGCTLVTQKYFWIATRAIIIGLGKSSEL